MRGKPALAATFLVALAAGAWWWWLRPAVFTLGVTAERNILLVTIDTLRADVVGSYGGRAQTPNLDRLAAHGARFTYAHAHAVVTLPSHASILTGHYPYEHGIRDNTGYRLRGGQPTIATFLKPLGFATGAFIGGFPLDHRFGLGAAFDVYDDRLSAGLADDSGERERRADAVVKSVLGWIGRQPGKWFAWTHLYDPHAPYQAPAQWAARFPSDPYLAEVSWTDGALGELLDELRNQPRPTLVIVTADHGESLGDHGELTHGLFAYESTLRVPLIIGEIDPRHLDRPVQPATIDAPVRHVDLLPTILDAAGGTPMPPALPGSSLRPLIPSGRGPDRPSYFEAMMAAVTRGWAPLRGVLVAREKYVDLPIPELYDLAADPREERNLEKMHAERARVMVNTLTLFDRSPPGRPREETIETVARLRSLGYIGGGTAAAKKTYTEADDPKRLVQIEQLLQRAAEASSAGKRVEAIAMYERVIQARPDTEDAYRRLALIHWQAGSRAEAIATLERALRNGVMQREVRNKLGQYLAETGQANKAIALLEHDTGDDPDALIALGNAYQLAGRFPDALSTFGRMITLDPASALAHENLGIAQMQVRDFPSAETSLRRAAELDPSLSGAHTALGVVLASTGRRHEAIDEWKRAVALDGTDVNAMFNLTLNLAEAGRMDEARGYGARFIAAAPPRMKQDVELIRKVVER